MRLESSILISRPIEDVFAFITDIKKVPLWMPVQSIRQISGDTMKVGAAFAQEVEFMGQRFEGVLEVTAYEPPSLFALTMAQGPFPLTNRMMLTSVGNATRLVLQGEAEPGKVFKLAGPLLMGMVRKQLNTQLQKLKYQLEV